MGILPNGVPFKHFDHVKFGKTLCVGDFLFYGNDSKSTKKNSAFGSDDWKMRGGGDFSKA